MAKEHPEMMITFCSLTLAPHIYGKEANTWIEALYADTPKALRNSMRKEESFPKKMHEIQALGDAFTSPIINEYGAAIENFWDGDFEAIKKFLTEEISVPVLYLFGTKDPLWKDYEKGNLFAIMNTKGSRTVMLEGERHLMECDMPMRVAWEVFRFIELTKLEDR